MPRGVRKVPAPEPVVEEAPVEEVPVPVEEPVEETVVEAVGEPAPEPVEEEKASGELPLGEGEEIVAQRTTDEAVLIVVTNWGRKVRIYPDTTYEVVTGPPFGADVRATPKPGRPSWKEPREPLDDE